MGSRDNRFTFAISLSVLNHLGRNLYRSFVTVLGEAISNAWDADAKNVHIYIDKSNNNFIIKDDGEGMTAEDFQDKFLKIGYSKRGNGDIKSRGGRPYIGRKGIGKLALLSCAEAVTIFSKKKDSDYVGGTIVNKELDEAIKDDLTPDKYPLQPPDSKLFGKLTDDHGSGTIIYFGGIYDGVKHTPDFFKKIIALNFRFSLIDKDFNIFIDDELVTHEHLKDLSDKTQFLWKTECFEDPYLSGLGNLKETLSIDLGDKLSGFIASVEKPQNLSILGTGEKVGIDLFVNGRLRERDLLDRLPTAQVVGSYLYGQIHYNDLDQDISFDPFTSSREGVVNDSKEFRVFLDTLQKILRDIYQQWDDLRLKHKELGDNDNPRVPKKTRLAKGLVGEVVKEYLPTKDSPEKAKVNGWAERLYEDAGFNVESYAHCFISENLIRDYVDDKKLPLDKNSTNAITDMKAMEVKRLAEAKLNIDITKPGADLRYLGMDLLALLVENNPKPPTGLAHDSLAYKPIRNALMHTALLSDEAKRRLITILDNIKARIVQLLS